MLLVSTVARKTGLCINRSKQLPYLLKPISMVVHSIRLFALKSQTVDVKVLMSAIVAITSAVSA